MSDTLEEVYTLTEKGRLKRKLAPTASFEEFNQLWDHFEAYRKEEILKVLDEIDALAELCAPKEHFPKAGGDATYAGYFEAMRRIEYKTKSLRTTYTEVERIGK